MEIVKINKEIWHVDLEYPQGNKLPNLHVQRKGKEYKIMIKSLDDLEQLPKSIRNNKKIINAVKKGLKLIGKLS